MNNKIPIGMRLRDDNRKNKSPARKPVQLSQSQKKARTTYKKQRSATVNSHENFLPRGTVGLYLRSYRAGPVFYRVRFLEKKKCSVGNNY